MKITPHHNASASQAMSAHGSFKIDPFKKMCIVFDGDYTEEEIKETVRTVGRQFEFKRTGEEKYHMIGSTAIELAKGKCFTEMQLLRCVADRQNEQTHKYYKAATDCAKELSTSS